MKKRICFIVATPVSAVAFLKEHIAKLSQEYDVYLVANAEQPNALKHLGLSGYKIIKIERSIELFSDIKALWQLFRYFVKMKFDAVHSVTPKAGLITSIAAFFARVPHRIHIYTGQVWATKSGFIRCLLKFMDQIIAKLNNHILVDGEGQRQYLIQNKVVKAETSQVLGDGSICGVNVDNFTPSKNIREQLRKTLKIRDEQVVFIFMGRLNRDKGITELLEAFNRFVTDHKNAYLLLLGFDEENYKEKFPTYENLTEDNFLYYGPTNKPYEYLQVADVFVLPTYREGFGSSVIEASCLGLPVICSDAYGVMDAMVDNVTGLRCKVADVESLKECLALLYKEKEMRLIMGKNGRERVLSKFSSNRVSLLWLKFYSNIFSH